MPKESPSTTVVGASTNEPSRSADNSGAVENPLKRPAESAPAPAQQKLKDDLSRICDEIVNQLHDLYFNLYECKIFITG